jgi:hypothetical protein
MLALPLSFFIVLMRFVQVNFYKAAVSNSATALKIHRENGKIHREMEIPSLKIVEAIFIARLCASA